MHEYQQFRNPTDHSESIALGCSHTWGVGVEANEAWPSILGAMNFGLEGASGDQVVRIANEQIPKHRPRIVYCLWPDWSRFEYVRDGKIYQSLPTDPNRIDFMSTHDDRWCRSNFSNNLQNLAKLCSEHNARLIDMTLYDLIPYIDHADRWPLSRLGHHYSPEWHRWVADLFKKARDTGLRFPLAYD